MEVSFQPLISTEKSATRRGGGGSGTGRIENEGKANNGVFSLSAFTSAAVIGASARTVDLRLDKIEPSS